MSTIHLNETQRAALLACAQAGQLHRSRDGYGVTRAGCKRFHQRSLYALVRAGLTAHADGESQLRCTAAGRKAVEHLRSEGPRRLRPAA